MRDLDKAGVYAIVNINEGIYVGSTKRSFRERWYEHKAGLRAGNHCSPKLQRAWDKWGQIAFEFHILEIVDDLANVPDCEQKWLTLCNKDTFIYNTSPNVGTIPWWDPIRAEKARKKLSKTKTGVKTGPRPPEFGRKLSKALKGRKHTEEHRRHNSEAQKGKKLSEETKRKIGLALKGRKLTEEHKRKIGLPKIGKPRSEETKRKLREANLGKKRGPLSEEQKQKISRALKGRILTYPNPMLGKKHTEETKRKISESQKRRLRKKKQMRTICLF